jgi:lysine 6-dehydrogenase
VILRDGQIVEVDTFDELETLELPAPLGTCEAFTTSGGTSTCPWTFEGQVKTYEYKTVRYPGHYEKFKLMRDLGLLELDPVRVGEQQVVPRELFHAVVKDKIDFPEDRDLVVLRTTCRGLKDGQPMNIEYTLIDYHDEATGFSAMSRTTGFPASIVAIMMAQGRAVKGGVPLEKAIPAGPFLDELARRGIHVEVRHF